MTARATLRLRRLARAMGLGRVRRLLRPGADPAQLQMVWPVGSDRAGPAWRVPDGFRLRTFEPRDEPGWVGLMARAGFHGCDSDHLSACLQRTLPGGFFVIVRSNGGGLVATAMAHHNPSPLHPFGGQLSWVAVDPECRGQGLGYAVSAAITARLLEGGYDRIYLETDDWRLPAIKTYLKLGYVPFLYRSDMRRRWQTACEQCRWPADPSRWCVHSSVGR